MLKLSEEVPFIFNRRSFLKMYFLQKSITKKLGLRSCTKSIARSLSVHTKKALTESTSLTNPGASGFHPYSQLHCFPFHYATFIDCALQFFFIFSELNTIIEYLKITKVYNILYNFLLVILSRFTIVKPDTSVSTSLIQIVITNQNLPLVHLVFRLLWL